MLSYNLWNSGPLWLIMGFSMACMILSGTFVGPGSMINRFSSAKYASPFLV